MAQVFEINKGINKPILFKGINMQYIPYIVVILMAHLILFAILYLCGVITYLCLIIIVPPAIVSFTLVKRINDKYGVNGLLKKSAQHKLPLHIQVDSTTFFSELNSSHENKNTP